MRAFVVGAGPSGLLAAALLQRTTAYEVVLVEKRETYTRGRRVMLSPFLRATDVTHYSSDAFDADNVRAFFRPDDLADLFAAKRQVPGDVRSVLEHLGSGYVPLRVIEESLSAVVDSGAGHVVSRWRENLTLDRLFEEVQPGDIVLDCTGRASLLRNVLPSGRRDALYRVDPTTSPEERARGRRRVGAWEGNVIEFVLEHALIVTFSVPARHVCDERCKHYGNAGNSQYKVIPMIDRCHEDDGVSHVTGIVAIGEAEFESLPRPLDGGWLSASGTELARSINRFLDQHIAPLAGGRPQNVELLAIPLNLYRARHATNVALWELGGVPEVSAFLLGDAAMGSPYFQSISVGLEGAMFLAWLLRDGREAGPDTMAAFEHYTSLQWARVYMRSRQIRANKAVLEVVDDVDSLLDLLTVY